MLLQNFYIPFNIQCLPKHASCPHRMHLCTPIPSEMLAFELNADDMLEGLPLYPGGQGVRDLQQECPIWTHLTIKHFFQFETVHFIVTLGFRGTFFRFVRPKMTLK